MKQRHFYSTKNILEKELTKTMTFLDSFCFYHILSSEEQTEESLANGIS